MILIKQITHSQILVCHQMLDDLVIFIFLRIPPKCRHMFQSRVV